MNNKDAEKTFNEMLSHNKLHAGTNAILDHNDGAIHEAMVWATGGIWYFTHNRPERDGQKHYQDRKQRALHTRTTLHISKQPGG